jgi:hypothetical protein
VKAVVTQRLPGTLAGLNQPERDGIQLRGRPASLATGIGKSIFHLNGASPFFGVNTTGLPRRRPSATEVPRRVAEYVDKILKGANPADPPVGLPQQFEISVNAKTAQAVGLTVPTPLLNMATTVIN